MSSEQDESSRLLKLVEAIAIKPSQAKAMVDKYFEQSQESNSRASKQFHQEAVAKKIVKRYCHLAATSGGATALAGIVPGVGTGISMLVGGLADSAACMKLQVDMCMCLAAAFDWDLDTEDARHLSYLIAAGGTLEKAGVETTTRLASKAGVNMLRQYLKGAVLQAVKELFKKIGIIFTRKALEKMLPFGVGVVVGSSANYLLTKYVGSQAIAWFVMDRDQKDDETT